MVKRVIQNEGVKTLKTPVDKTTQPDETNIPENSTIPESKKNEKDSRSKVNATGPDEKIKMFFDENKFEQSLIEPTNTANEYQKHKNVFESRIDKKLRNNSDLSLLTSGNEKDLKALAFDLITEGSTDSTLYGMQVKKEKAYDLLDMPDIDDILQSIQHVKNLHYADLMELKDGEIKLKDEFIEGQKELYTLYAVTSQEKARYKASHEICKILNDDLQGNNFYRLPSLVEFAPVKMIEDYTSRKRTAVCNYTWIKEN